MVTHALGVPLSINERDRLIVDLANKDDKTEEQIAAIVGLKQPRINQILAKRALEPTQGTSESSKKRSRRRRKLTDAQRIHARARPRRPADPLAD